MKRSRILLVLGLALMALAPVVWLGGSAYAARRAFAEIEAAEAPTPADLAKSMHKSRVWLLAGLLIGAIGLVATIGGTATILRQDRQDGPQAPPAR